MCTVALPFALQSNGQSYLKRHFVTKLTFNEVNWQTTNEITAFSTINFVCWQIIFTLSTNKIIVLLNVTSKLNQPEEKGFEPLIQRKCMTA